MKNRYLLLSLLMVLSAGITMSAKGGIVMGGDVRPAYIVPNNGFYNGRNAENRMLRAAGTLDLCLGYRQDGSASTQGVGIGLHSFFADHLLGTPVSLYIFQGAPLLILGDRLTLGYEWNFGLSYGWRDNGVVTASAMNAYINVAALFNWKIAKRWNMIFGPEYTHFSNGDTMFPNGGVNTVNFRIGIRRYDVADDTPVVERIFHTEPSFARHFSFDLSCFGGWRADRNLIDGSLHISNRPYPVAALHFNPLYHFNRYLSTGPSLDLMYDSSADICSAKSFINQTAIGLSARTELKMPIFAVNVGIGYNFTINGQELKGLYGIFALKAFITKPLFLNVSYRLGSTSYSHNMLFGIGWRFPSSSTR